MSVMVNSLLQNLLCLNVGTCAIPHNIFLKDRPVGKGNDLAMPESSLGHSTLLTFQFGNPVSRVWSLPRTFKDFCILQFCDSTAYLFWHTLLSTHCICCSIDVGHHTEAIQVVMWACSSLVSMKNVQTTYFVKIMLKTALAHQEKATRQHRPI